MNALDEDWKILLDLFPPNWQIDARRSGAVERLRGFDSVNEVLRVLLMHVGCGYSLRETAVRAKAAGVAEVSDVTLLNRLRQAEGWLQHLCQALLEESGVRWRGPQPRRRLRAVDGTVIKEPGPTGSQWRLHYSLRLPELTCDYLQITASEGQQPASNWGVSRSTRVISSWRIAATATRRGGGGMPARRGRHRATEQFGLPLFGPTGQRFDLLAELRQIRAAGSFANGRSGCTRRSSALRDASVRCAKASKPSPWRSEKLIGGSKKHQRRVKPETREYARYVMVFTTLRASEMGAAEVLEYYRFRWQIELVFKRLKSILALGHLPKHDEQSSRAWLYGKLFVALLTQKLIRLGSSISPWGYELRPPTDTQSVA